MRKKMFFVFGLLSLVIVIIFFVDVKNAYTSYLDAKTAFDALNDNSAEFVIEIAKQLVDTTRSILFRQILSTLIPIMFMISCFVLSYTSQNTSEQKTYIYNNSKPLNNEISSKENDPKAILKCKDCKNGGNCYIENLGEVHTSLDCRFFKPIVKKESALLQCNNCKYDSACSIKESEDSDNLSNCSLFRPIVKKQNAHYDITSIDCQCLSCEFNSENGDLTKCLCFDTVSEDIIQNKIACDIYSKSK